MRIAAASIPATGGDRLGLMRAAAASARAAGADVLVLPEASLPGYEHLRYDASRPARSFACALAQEHDMYVGVSFLDGEGCSLGLARPDTSGARWQAYRKRFPSPAESIAWARGSSPGVVETPLGRIGLAICADVLQLSTWADLRAAAVELVLIAGAWPAYTTPAPPGLGWLWRGSNPYRDDLLARASVSLGAPVAFANASGLAPGGDQLAGGASIWSAGRRVFDPDLAVADAVAGPQGAPLTHRGPWRAFAPAYDLAGRLAGTRRPR